MTIIGQDTKWSSIQQACKSEDFLRDLRKTDIDQVSEETFRKLKKYAAKKEFKPLDVSKYSIAACFLCEWVMVIYNYCVEKYRV